MIETPLEKKDKAAPWASCLLGIKMGSYAQIKNKEHYLGVCTAYLMSFSRINIHAQQVANGLPALKMI